MVIQSPEWFKRRAPKCKTQDEEIEKAAKAYENSKFQQKVVKRVSKSEYITEKIFRTQQDVYDPSLLPGYGNGFALYKTYCRLWDKKAHSEYWCKEYLKFLLAHPERFWYALYAYAKGSSNIAKRTGNTKPYTGSELVTVINAIGVEEFFGKEMLFVDGDEFYPESKYVTYFVRFVNAYAGSWQGKKGFESITEPPNEILSNFGVTINSKPRPSNFAECPKCGCSFNISTGEIVESDDVPEGTDAQHKEYVFQLMEKAKIAKDKAIKLRKSENEKAAMQKKIARAKSAAEKFGLELSLDLDVEKVKKIANTLMEAAKIQNKLKVATSLEIDLKTLIWYLEEFRPS